MNDKEDTGNREERCCGACSWFMFECIDGWGQCPHQDIESSSMHCSDLCTTDKFVSRETMRHYLAVLIQANRWRRDMHVPAIYKMPDPAELGKAIDFAVDYIKKQKEL